MSRDDDRAVVSRVLDGDRDAYAVLVERYQARIGQMLWRMTGSKQDAEDLTQETFYRAFFALPSYKSEYRFSTWLFSIAYNLCLNHRRQHGNAAESPSNGPDTLPLLDTAPDPNPSPADVAARHEEYIRLWEAVSRLPARFREIVVLRHVEELSYAEISDVTGLPLGTVKSRLARARRELAEAMTSPQSG